MKTSLHLVLDPEHLGEFFPILRTGVSVKARVGCSIRTLLCEQFKLDGEYVQGRVTTIFLDGKAVDDIDSVPIRDGSTLALSAAMPGLAGATIRRGGILAVMRGSITHKESGDRGPERNGTITVKLFNLLLAEVGPDFLRRGILVKSSDLENFFGRRTDAFWQGCREILLDGKPATPAQLKIGGWCPSGGVVNLSVAPKV